MTKATGKVSQHTRTLSNGKKVKVDEHARTYTMADFAEDRRSPVEAHRHARLKEQSKVRRDAALDAGAAAAARGWKATKKRAKQSKKLAKSGIRRLERASKYASKRRRTMALLSFGAGVAEVGAGLAWSTGGLVVTSLSIVAATIGGALFLGGSDRAKKDAAPGTSRSSATSTRSTATSKPKTKPRTRSNSQARARSRRPAAEAVEGYFLGQQQVGPQRYPGWPGPPPTDADRS